jgi:hypothetical protein
MLGHRFRTNSNVVLLGHVLLLLPSGAVAFGKCSLARSFSPVRRIVVATQTHHQLMTRRTTLLPEVKYATAAVSSDVNTKPLLRSSSLWSCLRLGLGLPSYRKLLKIAALLFVVAWQCVYRPHGMVVNWSFVRPRIKTAKYLAMGGVFMWTLVQWLLTKRRQAVDSTSEWARYARYPSARGRALIVLLLLTSLQYFVLCKMRFLWRNQTKWRTTLLEQTGDQFTVGLLQLGPLYIKLGQIVSCREHLLPTEWIRAMERLQDRVPAQTGSAAVALAHAAWPAVNKTLGSG